MFRRLTIVGVGLIGGSLGMTARQRKLAETVVGVAVREETLVTALECGAIDEGTLDLAKGVTDADCVVLAAPVGEIGGLLRQIGPHLKSGAIVTDVGSTKSAVMRLMAEHLPSGVNFLGGHPMCGSEQIGVRAADPYLFENAYYILTPLPSTPSEVLDRVRSLVDALGAQVVVLPPDEHDLMVAAISHLPYLLATSLVNSVDGLRPEHPHILMLAAGGFRDLTRIANGHPVMWRDVCLTNRDPILNVLQQFRGVLDQVENMVLDGRGPAMEEFCSAAREVRSQMPFRSKGLLPTLPEVVVILPDQPGEMGRLSTLLGMADINIKHFEILRVREGDGGTLRLVFADETVRDRALVELGQAGYKARIRS